MVFCRNISLACIKLPLKGQWVLHILRCIKKYIFKGLLKIVIKNITYDGFIKYNYGLPNLVQEDLDRV